MTKKPQTQRPKKRGSPKAERLFVSEDPEIMLARLLKPAPPIPKPAKPKRTK
jgi:hypothetical protein